MIKLKKIRVKKNKKKNYFSFSISHNLILSFNKFKIEIESLNSSLSSSTPFKAFFPLFKVSFAKFKASLKL